MATSNILTVGKGKLYFNQFAYGETSGQGERYLGNAPGFNINTTSTKLEHTSSESGIGVTDFTVDIGLKRAGTMTIDNISMDNLALYFQGTTSTLTQASGTDVTETITVKAGQWYQLGVTAQLPQGVRKISGLSATVGVTPVTLAGNITVDETRGRIYIEPANTANLDNAALIVTYDVAASTRKVMVSSNQALFGSLRFIADNVAGANNDIYIPYIQLSPSGNYEFIGDNFQTMTFDFTVLQRDSATAMVYADGQPA